MGTGLIVFVVSFTGSIYTFKDEIKDAMEPWRFVKAQDLTYALPSQLLDTAKKYVLGAEPTGITYDGREGAAAVGFWIINENQRDFKLVFMNPYTAEFIRMEEPLAKGKFNFFEFIKQGHTRLWLPRNIGRPVVGVSVLIFVILLITGLIIWWPKKWSRKNLKKKLSLKLSAKSKKLKYDLHHSLGMYVLVFALIIAITGLTWSFKWFDNAVYWTLSAGEIKSEHKHPHSDPKGKTGVSNDSIPAIDRAFVSALKEQADPERVFIFHSQKESDDAIEIVLYKYKGKFYHHNAYFYDRYSLEKLSVEKFDESIFADKMDGMYYDIHTGAIAGIPGKIIVFIVGLICASLPVTGFWIWWKKRNKKSGKKLKTYSN